MPRDARWEERCPERTVNLSHIHSHGYCLMCGAKVTAPWPDPQEITGRDIEDLRGWTGNR